MRQSSGVFRACLLLAAALSCSGSRLAPKLRGPSLLTEAEQSPAYASPAAWRYHPPRQAPVRAERELGPTRVLYVGRRGERWILDKQSRLLEAGAALAPEDLIATLDVGERLWFVGASGTSYEAASPLGRFVRSSAPLEPLLRVTAQGRSIVGIRKNRTLVRSTDAAATFTAIGPKDVGFVDVELANNGSGLALAIPEQLFSTADQGATFTPLDVPNVGALAILRDPHGSLRIQSVLGPMRLAQDPVPRLVPGGSEVGSGAIPAAPPRGPNAGAIAEGRAIVLGTHYLEIAPVADVPQSFELLQGPLDGRLEATPLAEAAGCRFVRLAGFGQALEFACLRSPGDAAAQPVEFYRSEATPVRWQLERFSMYASATALRLAMGASGALIATGLCPLAKSGCNPGGVYVRRRTTAEPRETAADPAERAETTTARSDVEMFAAGTPSLTGVALALAFSVDGRFAYAVGRRTKTSAFAVFVSQNGGRSFEGQDLDIVRADAAEEDEDWERSPFATRLEALSASEDGSLALIIANRRAKTLVVLDERGHVLSSAKPPEEHALLAAVGMRAFAVSPATRRSFESLDGGVTWTSVGRFPIELCPGEASCDVPIRCAPLGCVIGAEMSRIGWSGQRDEGPEMLPPPSLGATEPPERKLAEPLSCMLDEASWQALPGVRELPTAHDAALGKLAWVSVSTDIARGAVGVAHGLGGPRPHVEYISLLDPLPRGDERTFAVVDVDQVEGVAALRYPTPQIDRRDTHLRNVEVAWDNALEGKTLRAHLPDGGPYSPGDFVADNKSQRADPDLLSIAEGGIYLRLHHAAGNLQDTWFLDGKSIARVPPVQWPDGLLLGGRAEMAHLGSEHVPLLLFGRGTAVLRARLEGSEFKIEAVATGLYDPGEFGLAQNSNIAYVGSSSGLYLETRELAASKASAFVFPFRKDGPVLGPKVAVPTQLDLGPRPKACSAGGAASGPRVVAAYVPGTRHAVVVGDVSDPPRLLITSYAVLQGTPAEPCARAYDAEPVAPETGANKNERALVLLDDLEHAWLFRAIADPSGEGKQLQFRLMHCRFDASLDVPVEVYRAPGTLAPR